MHPTGFQFGAIHCSTELLHLENFDDLYMPLERFPRVSVAHFRAALSTARSLVSIVLGPKEPLPLPISSISPGINLVSVFHQPPAFSAFAELHGQGGILALALLLILDARRLWGKSLSGAATC